MSQNVDESEEYELFDKESKLNKQDESSLNDSNTLTQLDATLTKNNATTSSSNYESSVNELIANTKLNTNFESDHARLIKASSFKQISGKMSYFILFHLF
jgi:hypothetical protein